MVQSNSGELFDFSHLMNLDNLYNMQREIELNPPLPYVQIDSMSM
jgi:hypothetical protein